MARKKIRTLSDWLEQREMSQVDFARLVGASQPTVSKWINDRVPRMPRRKFWRSMTALGIPRDVILNPSGKDAA